MLTHAMPRTRVVTDSCFGVYSKAAEKFRYYVLYYTIARRCAV